MSVDGDQVPAEIYHHHPSFIDYDYDGGPYVRSDRGAGRALWKGVCGGPARRLPHQQRELVSRGRDPGVIHGDAEQ